MRDLLLNKSGKGMGNGMKTFIWIFAIVGILAVGVWIFGGESQTVVITGDDSSGTSVGACVAACPSDLTWSGTVDAVSLLNESGPGVETFDSAVYFYNAGTDNLKTSITDTTAGAVTLTCGNKYDVKVLSSSGANGDQSRIRSISAGTLNSDGSATFTACGDGERISLGMHQNGAIEIRARDVINDGLAFDASKDNSATDYETTDGVNFSSSTNITALTIGSGGEFHYKLFVRATTTDNNVNDQGVYLLVDIATSTWNKPTVSVDGSAMSDIKGTTLNADEVKAYADYEYVYLIPKDKQILNNDEIEIDISIFALSGQDPTGANAPSIDFSPIGSYVSSLNPNVLKIGAVDDSSSRNQIYTLHDTVYWII